MSFVLNKIEKLKESKNFCISPWIHLHVWPNGNTYPCCMTPPSFVAGNVEKNTIQELANSDLMTSIRKDMLQDKPAESCQRCYELERSGSESFRNYFFYNYGHHFEKALQTSPEGKIEKLKMAYVDIRFSNVCNFKCRTCGLFLSSGWFEDDRILKPNSTEPKFQKVIDKAKDLWAQFDEFIDEIEEINFVGGEPMFTDEHWKILEELDRRGKHNVALKYNTNFSTFKYRDYDAIEFWKKFKNVEVKASLDGAHERGEYIRKGLRWEKAVENRRRMIAEVPHVLFQINSTVSNLNVLHILDFHKEWVEQGLVDPNQMTLSFLLFPEYYRIQALPKAYKETVRIKIHHYLAYLRSQPYAESIYFFLKRVETIESFMFAEDREYQWKQLLEENGKLDKIRNESIRATFKEFEAYL